ncbi:MAG TPA: hypothetical protein VGG41_18775 [Solirubrobacteraceae bacterium]
MRVAIDPVALPLIEPIADFAVPASRVIDLAAERCVTNPLTGGMDTAAWAVVVTVWVGVEVTEPIEELAVSRTFVVMEVAAAIARVGATCPTLGAPPCGTSD